MLDRFAIGPTDSLRSIGPADEGVPAASGRYFWYLSLDIAVSPLRVRNPASQTGAKFIRVSVAAQSASSPCVVLTSQSQMAETWRLVLGVLVIPFVSCFANRKVVFRFEGVGRDPAERAANGFLGGADLQ